MNIKSLLLGSAAALAVVSGAQAADAVVAAEPEPMEYVKVCDAYGTGYFYIPGTETCLKIGGQVRYEKRFQKVGGDSTQYDNHGRIKLDAEARNDSEWGTVYSWIRIQGEQYNNGSDISGGGAADYLHWYYTFGIGGLEFGNFDSQWAKFFGYGGFTDDGGVYTSDWNYPDSRQYISYTADFGSWKAYISLDNDADEYYSTSDVDGVIYNGEAHSGKDLNDLNRGRKYMPDVSAGVSGTFGDWQVAGGVAYDESAEAFAVKKLVAGNFGMFGVRVMGLYSNSDQNIYFNYDGFSAIVGLQAKVTDTITLAKDIQWWDNGSWRIVGDVNWEVASGFSVLLEGAYSDQDNGPKTKSGMLRFQRSF
ncbi:porin [Rhizobium sp. KVB221]|uniref:Porin n=1 Tax=Rhizobium setariae TaxID=2801340 RepID=A0A936YKA6_9HYPH|nr:porin [Rhizobium setariae]MBL0371148.1 porin [Rhizobium setariae]